jgi:hypothetical protein
MTGTKKLSTIRKEIEMALASSGKDPIQRLERQIASSKRKGDNTEVMEGLKRFLQLSPKHRRRPTKRAKPVGTRDLQTSKPNKAIKLTGPA